MTPKEKAEELVFEFTRLHTNNQSYAHDTFCAVTAVDRIINIINELDDKWHSSLENQFTDIFITEADFWKKVKEEI